MQSKCTFVLLHWQCRIGGLTTSQTHIFFITSVTFLSIEFNCSCVLSFMCQFFKSLNSTFLPQLLWTVAFVVFMVDKSCCSCTCLDDNVDVGSRACLCVGCGLLSMSPHRSNALTMKTMVTEAAWCLLDVLRCKSTVRRARPHMQLIKVHKKWPHVARNWRLYTWHAVYKLDTHIESSKIVLNIDN